MSSLRNAVKSQKTHRERHQAEARSHLGLLEKKKDYKERAKNFSDKRDALKLLRKRALNRNPDEFYFHMINSQMQDGEHIETPRKEDECTPEQLALMQTQDLKYIANKRLVESRKIEKLQSQLHLLGSHEKQPNKHTFFVDSKDEAKKLSVAERLQTHPALLSRTYNRPKLETLRSAEFASIVDEDSAAALAEKRAKAYRELEKRIEREKQLLVAQQKMELKRVLQNKKEASPERVTPGTKDAPPVYKWKTERKR